MTRNLRSPISLLSGLLFFSGASALIYQVLWLRLLGLVFGVTVYATSTVLASFMAGLAVGSVVGGRLARHTQMPLVWLAVTEALIAISAVLTPVALDLVQNVYAQVYRHLPDFPGTLTAARFACSFGVLLVPTVMMGSTFPLAVRASGLASNGLGRGVSILYASNTAGAVTGTLLAGFYLIGSLGIFSTFRIAATINLSVAVLAALTAWRCGRSDGSTSTLESARADGTSTTSTTAFSNRIRALVLAVFIVSGFTTLALEVTWFRVLVLFVPATIYAFATMLATVLAGIAVGSSLMAPRFRQTKDDVVRLGMMEMALGVVPLLSLAALAVTYQAGWRTSATVQASMVAILPTTLLMGMAFPIGVRLWVGETRDEGNAADRVGRFYALNVCGAIAGSVAGGFLLLPRLGTVRTLLVLATLNLVSGVILLLTRAATRARFIVSMTCIGVSAFVVAVWMFPDPFEAVQKRRYRGERELWREEGVQTTVGVYERSDATRVLYLDGLHQANDSKEMVEVHRQIGHLPMALHASPNEALLVGLGGGVTAGAVSQHTGVRLDVVELSPAVVRGSDWFRHVNYDVVRLPHVRLRIDDGRNYLLLTEKRYDVVAADLIQPIHAGAGNLYSSEYFHLSHRVIRDEGLVLQWIGHRPKTHYELIMRTFLRVFPHTTLWANGTLMVGSRQPLRISRRAFDQKLTDVATRAALKSIGIEHFDHLLSLYTAGPEELRRFVGPGPVLTDDRPRIEYERSLPPDPRTIDVSSLRGDVRRHLVP